MQSDVFSVSMSFCQVSLSVDHPQKVLMMGHAVDFGTCKAAKKNGEPCSQLVNLVRPKPSTGLCIKYKLLTLSFLCLIVVPSAQCPSMNASTASTTSKPSTRR